MAGDTPVTPEPKVGDTWFRFEDHRYASVNEWDEVTSVTVQLQETTYTVAKVTQKGVWLENSWTPRRFVLRDSHKRFAWPTKQEALLSLKARKSRQMQILSKQLNYAERAANLADHELKKLDKTPQPASNELEPLYF